MESLGRLQFNLNATINKAHSNFKKYPKDRITVPYVETRLEALEDRWATFRTTHLKIIAETKQSEYENHDYYKRELYEFTEELYIEYKTELKESLLNLTTKEVGFNQSDKEQIVSSCIYCSEKHKLSNCKRFAKLEVNARRDFAQSRRLCFDCLKMDHPRYSCHQKTHRKKKHHSLLHQSQLQKSEEGVAKTDKPATSTRSESSNAEPAALGSAICCHQQVLATNMVNAQSSTGTTAVLRSLIDQGSRTSFITESAVQLLGLKRIPHQGIVSGIGGRKSTLACKATVLVKVQSRRDPNFICTVKAQVLGKLTGFLPDKNREVETPTGLPSSPQSADPSYKVPDKIDLLLGAEVYGQMLFKGIIKGPPGTLFAQNTKLGWILSGRNFSKFNRGREYNYVGGAQCTDDSLLKRFWELAAEPTSVAVRLTVDEEKCEEIFRRTTKRDESGRFVVRLPFKTDEVFKILGLTWNRKTDEFEYTVQIPPLAPPITKRKVVSDIARLFDPLGWLAPVITRAKVFIQRTWLSGIGWDEELPASLMKDWITFRNALTELTNFRVPRWINSSREDKSFHLHGFSDASSEAYAAVVYARSVDRNGDIHVSLITSKTRVAPIKQVSIPRLELCGAALLAKLLNEVASTLKVPKENKLEVWKNGPNWLKEAIISYNRKRVKIKCHVTTTNDEGNILARFS